MIKANRPVSMMADAEVTRRPMKGGGGVNQNYRLMPDEAKTANAQDAHKDSMSKGDYDGALKRAMSGEMY